MFRPTPASGNRSGRGGSCDVAESQRLAQALQSAPDQLDEVTRARLERNMVEAWRARGAHAVPLPRSRSGISRTVWAGSLAASAGLGVALGLFLLREPPAAGPAVEAGQNLAHFDLVIGDGAVQSGTLVAGQVLESGKRGHIEVSVGQSRLDVAPDSRVRFDRLDPEELRVSLVHGRVDVAFNPEHEGGQQLSVDTSAARVSVVGTRFSVEAAANRDTRVRVTEGVVRVEPRRGGAPVMVRAGEEVTVPIESDAQPSKAQLAPAEPAAIDAEEPESTERAPARARKAGDRTDELEGKLESARQLILQGKHSEARQRLQRLIKVKRSLPPAARVEALVLIAESFTAQGQVPRAAAAYRHAVEAAPREAAGHNALFALARLLDRYTQDNDAAASAYREYLTKAPKGALARQAREALCRLSNCR